jgi:hypothetical protein
MTDNHLPTPQDTAESGGNPFDGQPPEQVPEHLNPLSPHFNAVAYYEGLTDPFGRIPKEHFDR